MQVFIIGSALETAKILDKKRLHKQIIECKQILKALNGETKAWKNHPCTLQYKGHETWLNYYLQILQCVLDGDIDSIEIKKLNCLGEKYKPCFHTELFFNQMKRRLYTKNKEYYKQYSYLGESNINWYYVNGVWKYYLNGKEIKK